jgi:hypothetical protein
VVEMQAFQGLELLETRRQRLVLLPSLLPSLRACQQRAR